MPAYDRAKARDYALTWATARNPAYPDYSKQGGDCTNFVSQCLCAGGFPMDPPYARSRGWLWWADSDDSGRAWRAVMNFQQHLGFRKWMTPCDPNELAWGDVVFLGLSGSKQFTTHVMVVSEVVVVPKEHPTSQNQVFLCGHTLDQRNNPLWTVQKSWGVQCWKVADRIP